MDKKELVILAIQASILATVFGFGLKTKVADLVAVFRQPLALVRAIVAVFVVMPLLAILLALSAEFAASAEIALIALSLSPMPPLLPKKIDKAEGSLPFGIALMIVLACLSIATIPLSLWVIDLFSVQTLRVPLGKIVAVIGTMILVPLAAGMALRTWLPAAVPRAARIAKWVANILLPLAVVLLLAAVARGVLEATTSGSLFALGAFVAVGLAIGHYLGGPDPDVASDVALATACRHPAIALTIAGASFPDQHFGATIVLYLLVSTVVALPYVLWMRRRLAPPR